MSNIEELQARVVSAEARLALIGEEHHRYSDRLVSLMSAAEAQISEQSAEAAIRQAALDALLQENEQLRTMLHTLLLAVEAGNGKALAATMHDLEAKFSAMLATKADDAPAAAGDDTATDVEAAAAHETDVPADDAEDDDAEDDDAAETEADMVAPTPDDAKADTDSGAMDVETAGVETADVAAVGDEAADDDVAADDATPAETELPADPVTDPQDALDATMSDGLDATGDDDTDPSALATADNRAPSADDAAALADAEDEIAFEDEPLSGVAEDMPAAAVEDAAPAAPPPAETTEAETLVPVDAEPETAAADAAGAPEIAADAATAVDGDNAADALLAMHAEEDPESVDLGFADAPPAAEDESPMKQILHGVRQQLADSDRSAAVG